MQQGRTPGEERPDEWNRTCQKTGKAHQPENCPFSRGPPTRCFFVGKESQPIFYQFGFSFLLFPHGSSKTVLRNIHCVISGISDKEKTCELPDGNIVTAPNGTMALWVHHLTETLKGSSEVRALQLKWLSLDFTFAFLHGPEGCSIFGQPAARLDTGAQLEIRIRFENSSSIFKIPARLKQFSMKRVLVVGVAPGTTHCPVNTRQDWSPNRIWTVWQRDGPADPETQQGQETFMAVQGSCKALQVPASPCFSVHDGMPVDRWYCRQIGRVEHGLSLWGWGVPFRRVSKGLRDRQAQWS